ncbi:MAG TPA: metallophosphoesterase family protein [Polyangia bacterium]|nr:metallophosphoesterase family protein [Polyangia bacterium]
MRTVIVGDVHGCLDELLALVERCGEPGGTRYVMVGDLVAKGPDSRGVVAWARASKVDAVLGNHDAAVLRVGDPDVDPPPKAQHVAVAATLSEEELAWLAARPLWLELEAESAGPHVVVHGGLVPGVPLAAQERKHLLNLRSIDKHGEPSKKIEGTPWAALWKGPAHAVFGHDAVRGLQRHPFATGLDTGCVYGGALTALVLPKGDLVSIQAKRAYAPYK